MCFSWKLCSYLQMVIFYACNSCEYMDFLAYDCVLYGQFLWLYTSLKLLGCVNAVNHGSTCICTRCWMLYNLLVLFAYSYICVLDAWICRCLCMLGVLIPLIHWMTYGFRVCVPATALLLFQEARNQWYCAL